MELTFLGTSAGETYPGLWCECPHCTYARTHGGKNVRTNSCAVIDGKMMLDCSHGAFDNAVRFGINLTQATTLLITHPHEDHLYQQHLDWRRGNEEGSKLNYREQLFTGGPRFSPIPNLDVYGNKCAIDFLNSTLDITPNHHMTLHTIHEGESFDTSGYHVTPVRNVHGDKPGFSHSYIIQKDGKTLLYALDSGTWEEDQKKILLSFRYDTIIMEGTMGLNECYGGHMCLANNVKMRNMFIENGCFDKDSPFILTHMSPHWCPPHDWYEPIAAQEGMTLAYDGMQITI